jgi:hypothetical protein
MSNLPFNPARKRRLMLRLLKREPGKAGICSQCGCTEDNACEIRGLVFFGPCGWANKERTLCTNPECLRKAKVAEEAAAKAKAVSA